MFLALSVLLLTTSIQSYRLQETNDASPQTITQQAEFMETGMTDKVQSSRIDGDLDHDEKKRQEGTLSESEPVDCAMGENRPWPGKFLEYNALFLRQSNNAIPHLTELPKEMIAQLQEYLARHDVSTQWCHDSKNPGMDKVQRVKAIKTWPDFALKCLNKEYNEDANLPKGFGFEWFNGGTGMMDDDWALYASSENEYELVQYKREEGYKYPATSSELTWWQDYKEKGFESISNDGFGDKHDPTAKVPGFPHKKETLRGKLRRFLHADLDLADRMWLAISVPNSYRLWPSRGPKVFQLLQDQDPDVVALIEYDFHDAQADYFQDGVDPQQQPTFAQAMERLGYAHEVKKWPHELALYWKDRLFAAQGEVVDEKHVEAARAEFPGWGNAYGRLLAVKLRQKEVDTGNEIIVAVTKLTPKVSDPTGSSQQQQMGHIVHSLLTSNSSQRGAVPLVIMGDMNTDARVEQDIGQVFGQFGDGGQDMLGFYRTKKWASEFGTFYFGSVFEKQSRVELCTSPSLVRREFLDEILILQTEEKKITVDDRSAQVIVYREEASAGTGTNQQQNNLAKQLILPEAFSAIRDEYAADEATATIPDKHNPSDHFPVSVVLSMH